MKEKQTGWGREAIPDTGEREGGGEVHWEVITGRQCEDCHISLSLRASL